MTIGKAAQHIKNTMDLHVQRTVCHNLYRCPVCISGFYRFRENSDRHQLDLVHQKRKSDTPIVPISNLRHAPAIGKVEYKIAQQPKLEGTACIVRSGNV